MTRRLLLRTLGLLGVTAGAGARLAAQAPKPSAGEKTVWYFYRVKWGFQAEFEDLFRRNHWPVLMESQKRGRITGVKVYTPTYHGDGRADWTFGVEIRFRSAEAFVGPSGDEEISKQLYPDQAKFRKEEQRRFEILDAHWDVPLNELSMPR
jgi:hypothetical protein